MNAASADWLAGNRLATERRWEEAIACFERIVAGAPGLAAPRLRLARLQWAAGHYRRGRDCALSAMKLSFDRHELFIEQMACLRMFGEGAALQRLLLDMPSPQRLSITVLLGVANQLSLADLQPDALRMLDEARRGDPDFPPMLAARAQLLTYFGRIDEAEADLERCIHLAPTLAQPYWLLSRLRCWNSSRNHVTAIRRQLNVTGRRPEESALLAYALHKELDDLDDYPPAWEALQLACTQKRSQLDYSASDSASLFSALESFTGTAAVSSGGPSDLPIFIVGMHRSGTTLLEQILAGGGSVQGLGELYDFPAQLRYATDQTGRGAVSARIASMAHTVDWRLVGARYCESVRWRRNTRPRFVDKLPSNFLNVGFILASLPQAKVLHMKRDPMETCFSNLRELFSDACPYSYDMRELGDYYARYRRLMAHWHRHFPGRILDVDYADLVERSEPTVREICGFCEIPYEPSMLALAARRAVATASAVQVRGEIRAVTRAKWRPYAEQLEPLRQRLSELELNQSGERH